MALALALALAASYKFLLVIFFYFFLHLSCHPPPILAAVTIERLSVSLIDRDSPLSPFFNASQTQLDRSLAALLRSNIHADYLLSRVNYSTTQTQSQSQSQSAEVIPAGAEHLLTLSIGTPPVKTLAAADISSSLVWTKCSTTGGPLFDPRRSSTYRQVSCNSMSCASLNNGTCGEKKCQFRYSFSDGNGKSSNRSYLLDGTLALETLELDSMDGRTTTIPNIAFGCVLDNHGAFDDHDIGLLGLGPGPFSLMSQLGSSTDGKFSYCLVPRDQTNMTSILHFGVSHFASIGGGSIVSWTPLVSWHSLYALTLESISLGNMAVPVWPGKSGKIIVDAGVLFTYLPEDFLYPFSEQLADLFAALSNEPAGVRWGTLDLCYLNNEEIPMTGVDLTFHFEGANVTLGLKQTFVQVTEDVACLAMLPSSDPEVAIFGSLAQRDFNVEYDLEKKRLSFAPATCSILKSI